MHPRNTMLAAGVVLLLVAHMFVESETWWAVILFGWLGLAVGFGPLIGEYLGRRNQWK